jgi:hypothetical protein
MINKIMPKSFLKIYIKKVMQPTQKYYARSHTDPVTTTFFAKKEVAIIQI